ncbi:MAG TPA: type II secretion system protein, partial [Roseimicrobium sp.]|nr:type II secretion system protein [Roseimicrobium sp.]
TTAASLKLEPQALKEPLRTIDPTELSDSDRSLINRPVLLAYRYSGNAFALPVNVTRHELATILEAVADRTQLTSVLTTDGQMLTQASFMVKNNEKQFQRFRLPQGATLWACYVNGEPVKAEKDGEWTLVSLPQSENRDQAFAADVVYAQHVGALGGWFPKDLALLAPQTDLPSNYAEWQIYTPPAQRLGSFGGTMIVARGTTYDLSDAWDEFFNLYLRIWKGAGMMVLVAGLIGTLLIALVKSAVRHGTKGMIQVLAVFAIFAILAGMLLPSLAKAKGKAQRIKATSNLKQIALAARMYAGDNKDKFPSSFEQMMPELGSDRILIDPATGQRFFYVGEGKDPSSPNAILAYSPESEAGRAVAFADGSVRMMNSDEFVATVARDSGVTAFSSVQKESLAASPMPSKPAAQIAGEKAPVDGMTLNMIVPSATAAGVSVNGVTSVDLPALATASGIRSIRIDIPRTGRAFNFTKVLNNRQEPLSVKMSVMQSSVFSAFRTLLQLVAFLGGLFLLWREWHRPSPGSFRLAIAVLLTLTAVIHLLLVYRILHWALIVVAPLLWLMVMIWLVRRFWKLQAPAPASDSGPGNGPEIPASPALPVVLLLLGLALGTTPMPAMATPENSVPRVTILSAEYTGIIREQSAQFDVQMRISSAGTNQMITLFSGNTALQEFVVKKGEARLLRNEQSVAVVLANPGETILAMKLTTPVTGDVTGRKLSLTIPPTLSSRMVAILNDAQAEVEFPSAVSFNTVVENGQTRITGVVGASGRIDLAWTPKVQRTADAATAFCDSTSKVTLGGGVQNVRSTLNYHVTQGELRQLNVRLPRGHRLLRVEGPAIRTWELVAEAPGDSVHVELLKPVASSYALTIETEMLIESLPRTVYVGLPRAQGVVRESGVVAVKAGDEASLDVVKSAGLQRIDNTEFNKLSASGDGNWLSAWRYLKPDFDLQVQMSALKPQIDVAVQNRVTLDQEQARLVADLNYTIKRAGIFQLRLQIPPAYRVDEVTSQKNRMDWSLNAETRTLEIRFKERLIGNFPLHVALTQTYMNLPATLAVGGVHPLDTDKVTGTLSVSSDAGVSVKTQQFNGLTEIPVTSLAGLEERRGGLAFKYQSTTPASATALWSLSVSTEPVEPWLKAEVVNIITVTETLLTGRSVVRYEIDNAPVRDFKLRLPAAWKNVELVGQDIRRRDQDGNDWRVELQNRVKGSYLLTVTWEMPRPAGSNLLALAGVEVLNVERETGSFTLLAKAPLQLVEKSLAGDLTRIDARELPSWSKVTRGGRGEVPVLSYRYLRPGATVNVAMQRFTDAAVLQALVEQVRLSTVVADDGQMMTELSLSIRNNGRQHLEVELPAGATLWAAFVGGEPVRPGLRGNKLMLPLEHSGAESEPVSVELTYVGAGTFPKNRGRMELISPKLDLPLKNARWDLYLPPDYDYDPAGGTMVRDLTSTPVLQSYSIFEYGAREQQVKRELSRETRKLIQQAEGDLKDGNLQKLGEVFSRAKLNRSAVSGEEVRDLADLEAKLKKTQASNYIQAQNAYADNYFNGGQAGGNGAARSEGVVKLYEMEVAEKQVSKVQQAQELTLAKAQPLRVNLPTRGLVQSFTQVMQTEGDKPMVIGLEVSNTRDVGWLKLFVRWTAAFIVLWILCAITLRKRTQLQEA